MNHLHMLIKPASGYCNMNCEYCFYHDVIDHREVSNYGMMTDETLEKIVSRAYEHNHQSVQFMFQGGEPMLIGLGYYEKLMLLVKKYNKAQIETSFAIQTNGTLITPEYAHFFKRYNFLVGISIDGPENHHDLFRTMNDKGSFKAVSEGLKTLKKYDIDYNILTVITSNTVRYTEDIYRFLSNLDTIYLQFIPSIDSFDKVDPKFHIDNKLYAEFLIRLFDVWEADFYNDRRISIRYFDDLLKIIVGMQPSTCMLMGSCMIQNVIEADGSVYPCDFYVLDEYKLGNVFDNSFEELNQSLIATDFVLKSRVLSEECKACNYFGLCRGGCRRYKEPYDEIEHSKTRFCEAFKMFFDHRLKRLLDIAQVLINEQK